MSDFIKFFIEEVEFINGAKISLYYDGEFKKLHLFDLDKEGTKSLTNAINVNILAYLEHDLYRDHNLEIEIGICDIYLYGTSGTICEYFPNENLLGDFRHVHAGDAHLYAPFVRQCAERWHEQNPTLF